jgi:PAS domain S-box-containing protein
MNSIVASLTIGKRIVLGFSLLIILFLGCMITVELVGIPGTKIQGKFAAYRSKSLGDLELASGLLGERIASWFSERRIDVDGLTGSTLFRKAIESRDRQSGLAVTSELGAFLKSHPDVDALAILNPGDAKVIAATGSYEQVKTAADIKITPTEFSRLVIPGYQEVIELNLGHDNSLHLRIIRQVLATDGSNRIVAILVAESDVEEALRPLIWSVRNSIISHEWECNIASSIGASIVQFRVKGGIEPLTSPIASMSRSVPLALALAGIDGPYDGLDQFGQSVFAFHRQIKLSGATALGLVLKVEQKTVLDPARKDLLRQIVLWLFLLSTGFVLCVLLAKQIVRPIKELAAVARKVEDGDLTVRAAEMDQTEIGQLASVFNGMVAKIQFWQFELEAQIENRTHELQAATEKLQVQNEELQMNEEELRCQNDELLAVEEMLRVQITDYETSQQQLHEREAALHRQNRLFTSLLQILPIGVFMVEVPSGKPLVANEAAYNLLGRGILPDASKENLSHVYNAFKAGTSDPYPPEEMPIVLGMSGVTSHVDDMEVVRPDGSKTLLEIFGAPVADDNGTIWASLVSFIDITERKLAEDAINKRILSLTQPLESGSIVIEDLFDIDDLQRLQDEFATATGVASIITLPDGTPLTAPSNFTRLCNDIIRKTEKGCASCYKSDAVLGRFNPDGPNIQPCLSGGLWDAGAGIAVGGQHIANWLIGQVRDETQSEEKMTVYSREIGVDETIFLAAFRDVPAMTRERFEQIARALFTLANQLSTTAYQNIQQARFINERKQAEEQMNNLSQRLQLATSSAHLGIWDWNVRENSMTWDDQMFELYGINRETFPNSIEAWMNGLHPDDKDAAFAACQAALDGRKEFDTVFRVRHPDGTVKHLKANGLVIRGGDGTPKRMIGINSDITAAKVAEAEKLKLETQLQQAQKMESVGRLAGGVAHDFNNMLGVIIGHAELGLMHLDPANPVCVDLHEIRSSAERSADLTRQLLAFARKQTVAPRFIELNETITGMLKMLQRLIGEDIHLAWQPAPELCQIKMDPSQIDQILANLCVNARDAIQNTGRITIETGTCTIDADYCATNPEAIPGDYVRLVVSDDGAGMDRETIGHVFEPFFTTKELGKGTGLGLATVYGAVKQNNGFITIYSEPGNGTTFSIYLPRQESLHDRQAADGLEHTAPCGQESILLVEDEAAILNITRQMLEKQGYTVLTADTPGKAIAVAREHHDTINLLMTDVIMPEMNGRDLAKNILSLHPGMKRLFMSGYTADVIAHHGVLDEGVHFIQKPFSLAVMADMVREVLDSE